MRISLIHPCYTHKTFSENLRFVDEEFCKAPPIILAYVAAVLQNMGHAVQIIDAHNNRLSDKALLKRVKIFKPDLLGFRLDTYCFHDALRTIRYLKKELNGIKVLCGGINLTLYPEESFLNGAIDYGIIGDVHDRLSRVIQLIEKNESLFSVHGTVSVHNQKIHIEPYREGLDKKIGFNDYPYPARGLLDNGIYHSVISQRRNYTIMLASRGCPYHCKFCAIANINYSHRSAGSIINEITECYYRYGIREIDFFDAVFFYDRKAITEILDELIRLKLDIEWSCRSRVDNIDEGILKKSRAAGCRQIYFGIESCDSAVLSNIGKQINPAQICQALGWCKKTEIRALGFFMIGNQGETVETVRRTIVFARSLPLDYAQFTMAIAKPFSRYDKERIGLLKRDYWRQYIKGEVAEQPFPRTWTILSDEKVINLAREAYRAFYLRPGRILAMLLQTRSFKELFRYARVAFRLIFTTLAVFKPKRPKQ